MNGCFVWFVCCFFASQTSLTKENHSSLNMVVVQGLCRLCISVHFSPCNLWNIPPPNPNVKSWKSARVYGFGVYARGMLEFSLSQITHWSTSQKFNYCRQSTSLWTNQSINQSINHIVTSRSEGHWEKDNHVLPANITFSPGWFKYLLNGHKSFDHKSSKTRSQGLLSLLGCKRKETISGFILSNSPKILLRYGCGFHTTGEKSKWFQTLARKTYGSDCQSIAISCTTGFLEQSDAKKRTMDFFKSLLK